AVPLRVPSEQATSKRLSQTDERKKRCIWIRLPLALAVLGTSAAIRRCSGGIVQSSKRPEETGSCGSWRNGLNLRAEGLAVECAATRVCLAEGSYVRTDSAAANASAPFNGLSTRFIATSGSSTL
ncbi:hypothetical protein RTBOTA2_003425, partial [Rhodotorula toruloides]